MVGRVSRPACGLGIGGHIMNRVVLTFAVAVMGLLGGELGAVDVNVPKLIQETQRLEQGDRFLRLVWWIPTEFWKESYRKNNDLTQEQKENLFNTVDEYIVLCVVDAKLSPFGAILPAAKEDLVSRLSITVGQGLKLTPVPEEDLSRDTRQLFTVMKPVMANTLGQFGQGMEFICFPGVDIQKKKLLNPTEKGKFSVHLGTATYQWKLPLGSLLPPKFDADSGDEFPGNYEFSPFTGNKLVLTPPKKVPAVEKK